MKKRFCPVCDKQMNYSYSDPAGYDYYTCPGCGNHLPFSPEED